MNELRIELILHHNPEDLLNIHEIVKQFMQIKHDNDALKPELNITDEPANNNPRLVAKCPICKNIIMQGLIYVNEEETRND